MSVDALVFSLSLRDDVVAKLFVVVVVAQADESGDPPKK